MKKALLVVAAATQLACSPLSKADKTNTEAQAMREGVAQAKEHERWIAEESRRLLALCLDIAKFEKQWSNFAEWTFDPLNSSCIVTYKTAPADRRSPKECTDLWSPASGEKMTPEDRKQLRLCLANQFEKVWEVRTN